MRVFKDKPITKERFLYHLKEHQNQDAFVKGYYANISEGVFKGCAVGCSIKSISNELGRNLECSDHYLYEEYLGIPAWVARVEDTLFEGMGEYKRSIFPVEFGESLNEGSDLNEIKTPFLIYLLEESLDTLCSLCVDKRYYKKVFNSIEKTKSVVKQMIKVLESKDFSRIDEMIEEASRAEEEAWLAARSVRIYSRSAEAAADIAAESANLVSKVVGFRAESVEKLILILVWIASREVMSNSSTSPSVRIDKYEKYADKFLELIRECK